MFRLSPAYGFTLCALFCCVNSLWAGQGIDHTKLPGIVADDVDAEIDGQWKRSQHTSPYINQGYLASKDPERRVRFKVQVPKAGKYELLMASSHAGGRATNAPVSFETVDGLKTIAVDQTKKPSGPYTFDRLGEFAFKEGELVIEISTAGADGYVIADAVQLLTAEELKLAQEFEKKNPVAKLLIQPEAIKPIPQPVAAAFVKLPAPQEMKRLTSQNIDALFVKELGELSDDRLISDEQFLRRLTLDLIGRQPTMEELTEFLGDKTTDRRRAAADRLLASAEFGTNWANYWSDVIGSRQQEPELTFHDYRPFKSWLANEINETNNWDEIVYQMLTATGKVGENPAATYIGFHQGNSHRLAGETSRVFLGVQIHCAECHDHPFIDMPTEVFHGMAAFFTRTEAKVAQLHSNEIEVKSKTKGEHVIPGKKGEMAPTALDGEARKLGQEDIKRRAELANWLVSPNNEYFAGAHVNRVWSRLMGRGFIEPVDNMGDDPKIQLPETYTAVSDHFVATGYDVQELFRVIVNTRAYRLRLDDELKTPFAATPTKKLRGDEVFASLSTAIRMPNITPEREKKTGAVRFPPPPKSTRDLVDEAFGYDPSFRDRDVTRTMKQAMFMMNNPQLQNQISSAPESETFLAKLLEEQSDDAEAVKSLYLAVLARKPNDTEAKICSEHVKNAKSRGTAFEDLLWSLLNSAEFTTRR